MATQIPNRAATYPTHDRTEIERQGESLYQRQVRPYVEPQRDGEFIALDIDTGDYCVDADELAALRGLRQRQPDARVYFTRVGASAVYELRRTAATNHRRS